MEHCKKIIIHSQKQPFKMEDSNLELGYSQEP